TTPSIRARPATPGGGPRPTSAPCSTRWPSRTRRPPARPPSTGRRRISSSATASAASGSSARCSSTTSCPSGSASNTPGPTTNPRHENTGAKIRDPQLEKIPAMLVVGAKEAESEQVSYRDRIDGDRGALPLSQAVAQLKAEDASRAIRQVAAPATAEPEGDA